MKKKNQFLIVGIIVVILIIANSFGSIIKFVTDYMWFDEIGYTGTFLTKLKAQLTIGIPLFVILTAAIYLYLRKLRKKFAEESNTAIVTRDKTTNAIIIIAAAAIGFFSTIKVTSNLWFQILQFVNASSFNYTDPIFGHDVGFYVFKLPLVSTIVSFLINILFLLIVITVVFYGYLALKKTIENGTGQFEDMVNMNPGQMIDFGSFLNKGFITTVINQISIIGAAVFLLLGVRFILSTYSLLYSQVGRVFGAGYTDIFVTLNVYRILAIMSVAAAVMFYLGARKKNLKTALALPVAMIIVSIVGTGATGVVEKFIVEPDQLNKEKKYIEYNIESTQRAYDLDDVKEIEFPVENNLTKEDIEANQNVIENVRINDTIPIRQVYNQLQGIRPYYTFNDVDVDRYTIDGVYRQVFLAGREMDQSKLNEQAKTWINQYLKYTHGYGVTLSPVNKVTAQGQPEMLLKNIPPTTDTDLKLTRPEIYFGEKTNEYVIVNTDEKEFDYPSGSDNAETYYEGEAGIKLSFFNKLLFSIREASYKLLISSNINSDSRIVINRNIMDRVYNIASFMYYDPDPYIVINQDDGKLYWIIEGFTVTDKYPYSQPTTKLIEGMGVNFVNNSVKVVIDAYNGNTDFYIIDNTDPIIQTYNKIFPDLFKPIDQMPQGIRDHVRYSKRYFDIQSDLYRLYHIENPTVFFGREDYWDISKEKYMDKEQDVQSSYTMFSLPDNDEVEFLLSIPYTPQGKDNMTSLFVARNDGDKYGELILYRLPKNKTIPGPNMIEAKIDQDTVISSQLTLWSQRGSNVLRGNTLAIPIENSLIYVEPIYLQSDSESNFPEMKMVIVSYNDRTVMEPTLEKALEKIFGTTSQPGVAEPGEGENDLPTDFESSTINELVQHANEMFNKANEASKNGDWAAYGDNLQQLEDILRQLNAAVNGEQVTEPEGDTGIDMNGDMQNQDSGADGNEGMTDNNGATE